MNYSRWFDAGLVFTVLDTLFTYIWVSNGLAREANPIWVWLIGQVGLSLSMLIRGGVGIGLLAALWYLLPRSRAAAWGLPLVTTALGLVVLWHIVGAAVYVL